jgi:hypothetical protein
VSTSEVGITQSAVGSQQQQKDDSGGTSDAEADQDLANDPRLAKFTLVVHCEVDLPYAEQVRGKQVVLHNGKVCVCAWCKMRPSESS